MFFLFDDAEPIDGLLLVFLIRAQHDRWEIGVVGRVGEVLCLKTDGAPSREGCTVLSLVAVSPVVCIDLHSRFRRIYFHCSPAVRFNDACGKREFALFLLVQHKAVVVAGSVLDLFVVGINVLSDRFRLSEVERSAFHETDFTRRDGGLVYGEVIVGVDFALQAFNRWSGVGNAGK